MKSIVRFIRGLFSRRPRHQTAQQLEADSIERRQSVRRGNTLAAACRANRLTRTEARAVLAEFERLAPVHGFGEAMRMARDHASRLGKRHLNDEPWQPTAA